MSIRTNPMKAIPSLLKRLKMTKTKTIDASTEEKLKSLIVELEKIKNLFSILKENEEELLDTLTLVDNHLRNLDKNKLKDIKNICERIRESTQKLLPKDTNQALDSSGATSEANKREKVESNPSSSQHKNKSNGKEWKKIIDNHVQGETKDCFLSLSIFPEGAVIKKRHTIYWWIGEGLVKEKTEKTAEEVGEDVIEKLLKLNLIVPHGYSKCPVVNRFEIHPRIPVEPGPPWSSIVETSMDPKTIPTIHLPSNRISHSCLPLERQKVNLGDVDYLNIFSSTTIFNVGASYLNIESQIVDKMKSLQVLQLGRWKELASHHIEVESEEFLKELKNKKQLKYISLRGISRISKIPPSITQLESLEILDLKACHNLETLPDDIASLRNLTHLDVSQCYLLDSMPKGIDKLTKLQVLKGFVIGSLNKTPCRISHLANLTQLKRLSIHIGSEAVIQDNEFGSLENLSKLKCLKISWGVSATRYTDMEFSLPSNLEKLDLEGFPGERIPEWLKPSKLPDELKKLYIKGGKLKSLDHGEICHKWRVQILLLKYLNHLQIENWRLHKLFPSLRYVQKLKVLNHEDSEWTIEE
ncbi:hypothetical protein VNO77_42987 [Canavalia gladiata]|uniref:Disease resistance RPP13-like protein 4 n=1 Tax=Canavalia gladiata TaxID=3824 RepID=A0AAN9PPJ2_CANGL